MERRKVAFVLQATTIIGVSACANFEVGTDPHAVTSQARAALESSTKGPRVKVATPERLREIGCTAVGTVNGETQVAALSRSLVVNLAGRLDSVDAPLIDGKPGAGTLHIVSGSFRIPGYSTNFSIHCVAPMLLRQTTFLAGLLTSGDLFSRLVSNKLKPYPNLERKSDAEIASDLLLAPVRSGLTEKFVSTSGGFLGSRDETEPSPTYNFICGPDTDYACGHPTLPKVTVTATPGYPVIVDLSMIYHDYRVYSLSNLVGIWFYGGPDCGNASETWIALNEEILELENEANEMEPATAAVANLTCESEYTQGGRDICIDLFIMGERASFLVGDNRTFDPNAPYKASRAQIYINPSSCTVGAAVNTTRTVSWGPFRGGIHEPHKLNKVQAHLNDSAQCVVEWQLLNGWCQSNNTLTLDGLACPAIDGRITITSDGQGGWNANISEDLFPSRGLYKWNGSTWSTISERPGTIWLDLMSWRKKVEDLKIARDQAMPLGCNLQ